MKHINNSTVDIVGALWEKEVVITFIGRTLNKEKFENISNTKEMKWGRKLATFPKRGIFINYV